MKNFLLTFILFLSFLQAENLGVNEKLGTTIPLDLTFLNEQSKSVTLRKLMNGKPTLLSLNYFRCAGICTPQLNEMAKILSDVHLAENIDYKVITVDFAEDETVALACSKKKNILKSMSRPYVQDAWQFVIGENNSSNTLAKAVGFKYKTITDKQGHIMGYLHAATIVVLSPTGKIVRYLRGVQQLSADVTLALQEAKEEKVSKSIAKDSPFCFTEKPTGDILINKITKGWMAFMMLMVVGVLFYLLRGKKKPKEEEKKED